MSAAFTTYFDFLTQALSWVVTTLGVAATLGLLFILVLEGWGKVAISARALKRIEEQGGFPPLACGGSGPTARRRDLPSRGRGRVRTLEERGLCDGL